MEKAEISVVNNPTWGFPEKSDIDVGLNGIPYKIQEGKTVRVPIGVLENLEHAVVRVPSTDDKGQLLFDEKEKMIFEDHKRYIVQVFKDPRKKKTSGSTAKTEIALDELEKIDDIEESDIISGADGESGRGMIRRIVDGAFGSEV